MTRRPVRLAFAVLSLALGASACGSSSAAVPKPHKVVKLEPKSFPAELAGLSMHTEATAQAEGLKRPYIDGVGLYSLRSGPLLQATLEVGRFSPEADYKRAGFRGSVVNQIGTTVPKAFRVGTKTVFLTTGERQSVAMWFQDRYFFILSTRSDYKTPRNLLRAALELTP